MKRILLTGMSGVGNSSVLAALFARGFRAVDLDYGWSERGPDGDWLWREDRVHRLLADESSDILFVCGYATNQGKFYPQFDHVLLLSAPAAVLLERLRARTNNPYGKTENEHAEVLENRETVEPLLRRTATHEIRTDVPLGEVVEEVLRTVL